VGQDRPFVLPGERLGEVREALKLVVNLLSLAREELVYKLCCADRGASNDETFAWGKDTEFGCCSRCHILVRAVRWAFGTGVRPEVPKTMARASKAGAAAVAGPTTLMLSKYATICVAG
jgi:hypothetical protein